MKKKENKKQKKLCLREIDPYKKIMFINAITYTQESLQLF